MTSSFSLITKLIIGQGCCEIDECDHGFTSQTGQASSCILAVAGLHCALQPLIEISNINDEWDRSKNITSYPWEMPDVAGGGSVLNTDDRKVCRMDFLWRGAAQVGWLDDSSNQQGCHALPELIGTTILTEQWALNTVGDAWGAIDWTGSMGWFQIERFVEVQFSSALVGPLSRGSVLTTEVITCIIWTHLNKHELGLCESPWAAKRWIKALSENEER